MSPCCSEKTSSIKKNIEKATKANTDRIRSDIDLDLPELEFIELTVLVEWYAKEGFIHDAGVSYVLKTDMGSLLFDVGFGPSRPALLHNARKLGFTLDQVDALVISHLHVDHMGGIRAQKNKCVAIPEALMPKVPIPCYLPDQAQSPGLEPHVVDRPMVLPAGIATTGPLARSLFMGGYTEEQALVARVKDKGLVMITGCGHPTVKVIMDMAGRLSLEKPHTIGGGFHFPITDGRGNRFGIRFQTIIGTGKPPWQKVTDQDLDQTLHVINNFQPAQLLLSGHDVCDHSLERLKNETRARAEVLTAGATYRI